MDQILLGPHHKEKEATNYVNQKQLNIGNMNTIAEDSTH